MSLKGNLIKNKKVNPAFRILKPGNVATRIFGGAMVILLSMVRVILLK